MSDHLCQRIVYGRGHVSGRPCAKPAVTQHADIHYCAAHDPEAMEKRRQEHAEKYAREQAEYRRRKRLAEASEDLLTACIALQTEAKSRGFGLRIADEAIAKATEEQHV